MRGGCKKCGLPWSLWKKSDISTCSVRTIMTGLTPDERSVFVLSENVHVVGWHSHLPMKHSGLICAIISAVPEKLCGHTIHAIGQLCHCSRKHLHSKHWTLSLLFVSLVICRYCEAVGRKILHNTIIFLNTEKVGWLPHLIQKRSFLYKCNFYHTENITCRENNNCLCGRAN